MVKLQKPAPKGLTNLVGISKKKKLVKVEKPKKTKQENGEKVTVKKGGKKEEQKSKLLQEAVRDAVKAKKASAPKEKLTKSSTQDVGQKKKKKEQVTPAPTEIGKGKKKNKKHAAATVEKKIPGPQPKLNQPQNNGKAKQKKEKPGKGVKRIGPLTKPLTKKAGKKAFNKKQRTNKVATKEKKKADVPHLFEPLPYDENKFQEIVNVSNLKKVCKALKELVEKEVANQKKSIFSDFRYILDVGCFKIASCPKRMARLNLKHSLVDKDDDVVIIVSDLQRGAKVDYEPTIQHYEDLFREAGVDGMTVMPFNQLRKEYAAYEAKRKFCSTYDYFLCDGRLVGQAASFCGRIFQRPRTTFHSVRFDNPKGIKREIEKALCRTAYKQLSKGDLTSIPVGTHKHSIDQIAENIDFAVEQLKKQFPGGLGNIRCMYLKIDMTGTSSLPLYMSTAQAPEQDPYVVGPREQRMVKLRQEANEVLAKFNMTKEGDIVKLNKTQVERKRKLKEAREILAAESEAKAKDGEEGKTVIKKVKLDEAAVTKDTKSNRAKVKLVEKARDEEDVDSDVANDEWDLGNKVKAKGKKGEAKKAAGKGNLKPAINDEDDEDDDESEEDEDNED